MIKDFREYDPSPDKKANTPAAEFIFKVNDESRMVDDSRAKVFHTFVAKALFATKISRLENTYRSGLPDHSCAGPQQRWLEETAKTNAVSEKRHRHAIDTQCWKNQHS